MRPLIGVLVGAVAAWLWATPAQAASVKNVQTGTLTMSAATQTATLGTAVDATKAFIVCSSRTDSSNASNRATCELSNTTVTVTTGAANGLQVVRWYVVEFDGGVTVQRGVANFAAATGTVDVPIASVATAAGLGKSFHLLTERTTSTSQTIDEQWTIRGVLETTGGGRLQLTRNETGIAVDVAWQVIEMDGASVQRGLDSIAAGATTVTRAIASVSTANSFLVFSRRAAAAANGIEADYHVRGRITSATQLTFTRTGTTGATGTISWEVVSLSDGTTVQRGTSSTAAVTDTILNGALAAVSLTATVPWISASGGAGANTADLDMTSWSATLSSTTNLQMQRVGSLDVNSQVDWQVISFFRCVPATIANVAYSAVNSRDGQTVVTWSAANPVIILRKTVAFVAEAPVQGKAYLVNDAIGAATVVYNGAIVEASFTDSTVSNGTTYFYKVFVRPGTTGPCYSSGAGTDVTARPVATSTGVAWSYMLAGGASLRSAVAGDSSTVFYASNANRIIGLSSTNGAELWAPAATTGAVQGGLSWLPLSAGGAQVIGGDGGAVVYAVNVATGTTSWTTTPAGATAVQASVSAQVRAFADAAFATAFPGTFDVIIVGSRNASTTNNRVYALRSDTGATLWTFNLAGTFTVDGVIGQPWVDYARNRVYVTTLAAGGAQPSLWVINSLTGALVGTCPGTGCFNLGDIQSAPTLSRTNDRLWIGATNGNVFSVNLNTLTQNWTSSMALGAGASIVGFVWEDFYTDNLLYFSTADGNVWAVQDPYVSGAAVAPPNPATPVWKRAVAGASALLQYDFIYVGSSDGKIHQINMATGTDVKQFTVGDGTKTVGDVSTDDGTQLFVGTTEGTIYEISLPLP